MADPIVVISPETDPHGRAVIERLTAMGQLARLFDTSKFPDTMRLTLGDRPDEIFIDGEQVVPRSVYVRNYGLEPVTSEKELGGENWRVEMIALRERGELVHALVQRWEKLGVPIYNPPSADPNITKPYQIALLAAAGLPVPLSRWTNDPAVVREFARDKRIAYKPIVGGAATRELLVRDLTDERLALLATAPVCFQELLTGKDIRVYVVDGRVVCAIRIDTDEIDFRQNEKSLQAIPVEDELADICVRATTALGLRFTGMDLKAGADGRLRILELNTSPMFLGFDAMAGTRIQDALCEALVSAKR